MPTTISKKVWKEYFEKIMSGKKKLELRLADFKINEGDTLILEEWDKDRKEYTGRKVETVATYVLKTKDQAFWPQKDVDKYGFQIIQLEQKANRPLQEPRVGIGVMIVRGKRVLLSKRKGSHGQGEFAFPGGHLEYMESFANCARRETKEECGIEIDNIRFQYLANLTKYAPKHYVHIGLLADWKRGEPEVREPNKSELWSWCDINNPPQPIFETCGLAIQSYKTRQQYFDIPRSDS